MYVVWGKAYGNRIGPVIFVSLHVGVDFGIYCMGHVFQLYSQPVWMVSTNKRNTPTPKPPTNLFQMASFNRFPLWVTY